MGNEDATVEMTEAQQPAEQTQDREAADAEVLSEMFGLEAPETAPTGEDEEVQSEDSVAETSEVEESDAEESEPADAELAKARDFIKREKLIPQEVMDSMTPEQLLQAGEAARERIAETTRQWQRLQELEAKEAQDTSEEPSTSQANPADDPEWAQPFVDEFGEDLASRLVSKLDGYEQLVNDLKSQVANLQQHQMQSIERSARQQVGERFPGVLDDAVYSGLSSRMEVLAKTGAYTPDDAAKLIADAAKLEGLEEHDPEASAKKARTRTQRRNGIPVHNGKASVQKLSPKDLDDQIALAAAEGDYERVADLRKMAER